LTKGKSAILRILRSVLYFVWGPEKCEAEFVLVAVGYYLKKIRLKFVRNVTKTAN